MTFPAPDYIKTFLNNKLSKNNSDGSKLVDEDELQRSTLEEVTVYRDTQDNIEGFEVNKTNGKTNPEKANNNLNSEFKPGANSKTHLTLTSAGKNNYGTSGNGEEIELHHNDNITKYRKSKSLVKSKATDHDDIYQHTHEHEHNGGHHHILNESITTGSSNCTNEEHVHQNYFNGSIPSDDDSEHCHEDSEEKEQTENRKRKKALKKLIIATVLCFLFMCGEIVGGYLANSLAIMTDASHMLTDVSSFLVSIIAIQLAAKPSSKRMTFGWHRAEVIGAIVSVIAIWVLTGILVYLAAKRLISDNYELNGQTMLITASCAVAFNILLGLVLHDSGHGHSHHGHSHGHGHDHSHSDGKKHSHDGHDHGDEKTGNVNVRAAFIHVIGDLLQSLGVLIAAFVIYFKPEYKIADPICTFLFSFFVLATTITILRDTVVILMEGTPASMNYEKVKDELLTINGVIAVHDLRIWSLTLNQCVMSCHLAVSRNVKPGQILKLATKTMKSRYDFHSMTIQVEAYSMDMDDCRKCQTKNK